MISISDSTTENVVLTRKRDAALSMLLMTLLPSATTLGSDAKSLSKSTSCATLRLASEPDAIAIEQSASLSAMTSLTPSPVMPTVLPWSLSAVTNSFFCLGVTRPKTVYFSTAS